MRPIAAWKEIGSLSESNNVEFFKKLNWCAYRRGYFISFPLNKKFLLHWFCRFVYIFPWLQIFVHIISTRSPNDRRREVCYPFFSWSKVGWILELVVNVSMVVGFVVLFMFSPFSQFVNFCSVAPFASCGRWTEDAYFLYIKFLQIASFYVIIASTWNPLSRKLVLLCWHGLHVVAKNIAHLKRIDFHI